MSQAEQQWHLIDGNGQQCGPYTWEELQGFAGNGTISPATQLWREGTESWVGGSEVEGLFASQAAGPRLLTGAAGPLARSLGSTGPRTSPPGTLVQARRSLSGRKVLIAVGVAVPLLLVVLFLVSKKNSDPQQRTERETPVPPVTDSQRSEEVSKRQSLDRQAGDSPSEQLTEGSRKLENEDAKVEATVPTTETVPIEEKWTKILGEAIDEEKLEERELNGKKLWCVVGSEDAYTGWSKKLSKNGQPAQVFRFEAGIVDGPYVAWHTNGRKGEEGSYQGGAGTGLWTYWHENGQESAKGVFKDGERDGLWTMWYENGRESAKGLYKDGEQDGLWTMWHENGQESAKRAYKDGERDGLWTVWHENGQKKEEGRYKKGRRDGPWSGWKVYGGLAYEKNYEDPFYPEQATEAEKASLAALKELGAIITYVPAFTVQFILDELSDDDLIHFANLPRLEVLILDGSTLTDSGLAHLKNLTRLESLKLESAYGITDAGLRPLRELPNLNTLILDRTKVTDAGLRLLKGFPKLSHLELEGGKVTDAGLVHLKEMPHLRSLHLIRIKGITDAGLKHVRACRKLQSLSVAGILGLGSLTGGSLVAGLGFSDAGLAQLAGMEELNSLSLKIVRLTDAGLAFLKSFPKLEFVAIMQEAVTDSGLVHLEGLPELKGLELFSDKITDDGVPHLKKLSGLRWLDIAGTKISEAREKELQAALPKCLVRGPSVYAPFDNQGAAIGKD